MPYVAAQLRVNSTQPALEAALRGLTALNLQIIRAAKASGKPIPPLYRAGVRWHRDNGETWDSIDIVRRRRYGDCEDLAAWRAAELQAAGVQAVATVRPSSTPGVTWHAVVRWPNGRIEDPSRKLGM